jgi:hypothetical protein
MTARFQGSPGTAFLCVASGVLGPFTKQGATRRLE